MRLALIADIHGGAVALDAVLDDVDAHGCDALVALGDVVGGGPDADLCVARLRARDVPTLRGNHERYLLAVADGAPEMAGANWDPVRATLRTLGPDALAWIRARPLRATLPELIGDAATDAPPLLLCHAAPDDDYTHLHPATPETAVRAAFAGRGAPTVARGHNHLAFERRLPLDPACPAGTRLHVIALGSAGLPLDGTRDAQWTLLESDDVGGWRAEHRRVPYDLDAAAAAFRRRGYLEAGGVVARLVLREVLTGTHQLVPFMRYVEACGERPADEAQWREALVEFGRWGFG